ncbi:MAG: pyridoxamine 5'-phosphate oxidase [Sphingobacteriales bacterium]|nr:pyridoxamine 5'-phosphate oxidase [Sphingobacteriales bacterium]
MNQDLSHLRRDYGQYSLHEHEAATDPFEQFQHWYAAAADCKDIAEANAMILATADTAAQPSARVVLLKEYSKEGFVFYTNYHSRKGNEIAVNPKVALLFFWDALERQVRIEGVAHLKNDAAAEAYFQSRPLQSRLGAWASPQSTVIDGRNELELRYQEAVQHFVALGEEQQQPAAVIPKPPHWGGYRVEAHTFEFWQGRSSRLHDRLRYTLHQTTQTWNIQRLAP